MKRDLKSKVKMPAKRAEEARMDEELEMDRADLELPEEDIEEDLMAEEDLDMADLEAEEAEAPSMLEDLSDEDLLAEARARGLMPEDEEAEEIEGEEEEDEDEIMA